MVRIKAKFVFSLHCNNVYIFWSCFSICMTKESAAKLLCRPVQVDKETTKFNDKILSRISRQKQKVTKYTSKSRYFKLAFRCNGSIIECMHKNTRKHRFWASRSNLMAEINKNKNIIIYNTSNKTVLRELQQTCLGMYLHLNYSSEKEIPSIRPIIRV